MSSLLAPSQSRPTPNSVQLPRELWCDITARILGDYLFDLIIGGTEDTCEWDAFTTLLHTSPLVRSCTLDHLSSLCRHDHDHDYRPLVAHLRALRHNVIDTLILEEWDYAPGGRFFGLPPSLVGADARAEWEEGQGQGHGLPPVLVLAHLRHTLAASDAFAREGWDWFPYNALEVYDIGCTALLVDAYRAVPAYARDALLWRVVERIAALQVARIGLAGAIEKNRNLIETRNEMTKGHIAHPATSSEDLLVSVKRMLATELNITL